MESTAGFINSLKNEGITHEPDEQLAMANTAALLKKADEEYTKAIAGDLKGKLLPGDTIIDPKYISEARHTETFNGKEYKRPIVDLVQQGGGMYGIALVGYTYIMEKAGVRFYSLGGTSAGAINTILLGAVPDKVYKMESAFEPGTQATKSELLAHIIANSHFHEFMDRPGFVGRLQETLIRNFKVVKWGFLLIWAAVFVTLYIVLGNIFKNNCSTCESRFYDFFVGPMSLLVFPVFVYILAIAVLGKNFGINPGKAFYDWITKILRHPFVGIHTTHQLQNRMKTENTFDGRDNTKESASILFIASNLTHNRIVKFPQRAVDYWNPSENVNPAAYVRASMSIPFVFETFIPGTGHVDNYPQNQAKVVDTRFVDGGMLSNFPIREFHNHTVERPRFPTFGVLLSERDTVSDFKGVNLWNYIVSFLSTFRNFYDNDFLNSTDEIKSRVVLVNTKGFNWLDFWMGKETKEKLFVSGALAAIEQLKKFNFEEYQKIRTDEIQQST
ncbi:hypothetical protein AM493_16880 [Flavobacterium akiainvivens]|uniref:PNPLA domain-containing protein n=1 Tax=Flavobacterium akiainvivens TaxID=1202724 RepID=A0A0M8MJK4_9FLAO|nr:patatin-like phospholipase family protein [Flavobacterium akiainvivens]KOS07531.1 hypothetical protein AM493_16880 [Flavobacterium akiainvivens]SFQ64107.1 NTE family protein [Flavobacterium akiainvivens]